MVRVRTQTNTPTITTREYERDLLTGNLTYSAETPGVYAGTIEAAWMQDTVTPDFNRRQAQGSIIMNPLDSRKSLVTATTAPKSYTLQRIAVGSTVLNTNAQGWATTWSAHRNVPRTPIALLSGSGLLNELGRYGDLTEKSHLTLTAALGKATSPDAMALVTLAEFDQTIDLVHKAARLATRALALLGDYTGKDLSLLVKALKIAEKNVVSRGYLRPGGRKRLAKDVGAGMVQLASVWLGYRYGLMATVYDIKSYINAFGAHTRHRFTAQTVTAYENDSGWVFQNSNVWRDYYRRTLRKRSTTVSAGVLISANALTMTDRLGFTRVASSAWELVPWSFVLDWFVDIGGQIAAFEGNLLARPLGSWQSLKHVLTFVDSYDYRYDRSDYVSGGQRHWSSGANQGSVTEVCTYGTRTANPSVTINPVVDLKVSGKRVVDAVALLTTSAARLRGKGL